MVGIKTIKMKIIKKIITGLFSLAFLPLLGQDSVISLSLEQSCKLGIEQNVKIRHAELERQKAGYRVGETQSKLYPQLEAYSNFSYYYAIPKMIIPGEIFGQTGLIPVEIGTKYDWANGFRATQLLYNQTIFTSLKLAREMEKLSDLTLQQAEEEIIYQISQLYYLCQGTVDQITLLEDRKKNMDRLLEITALQSKNDLILKTDHSRVEVARDNLQTQIDNMHQLSHSQMSLFKYLVGLPLDSEIIISDSLSFSEENRLGNLFREPVSYRIELQLIDHQIELNRLHRKSIRQSYLPTLSGFGQLYYQGQRNEFDFFKSVDDKFYKVGVVGIQLTIPLFDGFEKKARLQQYDIELQQLNLAREDKINYFSKELLDAIHQYRNGLTVISRQKKNVEVAKEVYHVTLQGYRQQVVSLSDLLMSENELTEADLSYSHALVQLKQAALDLNRVRGELLIFKETH